MSHPLEKFTRLNPAPAFETVKDLVDSTFLAFNSARLGEACRVFADKFSTPDVTVGVSAAGALTPAGLGGSCLVPLMRAGLIDWMVMTGANIYHDLHYALGQPLYRGSAAVDDCLLREKGVVRIYDIFFESDVLYEADAYVRGFCESIAGRKRLGSAEFHHLLGKRLLEEHGGRRSLSVLMTAAEYGIPLFTSSPGDSTLGMNLAELTLRNIDIDFEVALDINQTAAIVHGAKRTGGRSGVLLLGGGSPKNFVLQTEPYIQEILMLDDTGHDYFIQFTDARPDTGGLSGATPSEAVSWGKITPDMLPDTVVCYGDTTVSLPILTAYVLSGGIERDQRRLYDRLGELVATLRADFEKKRADA